MNAVVHSRQPAFKFLMDTNVFIAAEPGRIDDLEPGSAATAELLRRLGEGGHTVYVHPAASLDIDRDPVDDRRTVRRHHFNKYPKIPSPPPVPEGWVEEFGAPEAGGNDDVDLRHLAAVRSNVVNYLVTEDRPLHRRAGRVDLSERVVTVDEALGLLRNLYVDEPTVLPTVDNVYAHELDVDDPIFDSLRVDYPEFDEWFAEKAQLKHREGWVIRTPDRTLAAVCLVKDEGDDNDAGLPGDAILKISTFKVSPDHAGNRYGELLLKAVFGHGAAHGHDGLYVTVFADRHRTLVALLDDFGFYDTGRRTDDGEAILAKRRPTAAGLTSAVGLEPLGYHVRYGPPALAPEDDQIFVVPIKPKFVARLFPDAYRQMQLVDTAPCGNAIRKAYLCNANTRLIAPGATLLFYRSEDDHAVFAIGVVDDVLASDVPEEVAAEVGTRTVYSMREIGKMAEDDDGGRREILAILFRQDRVLDGAIGLAELVDNGALNGSPQSITQADVGAADWIRQRIDA